jgi:hypothetical protein
MLHVGWMKNAIVYTEKPCCCVLYYDPQAQVLCNGLYGFVFVVVVCIDKDYFLLLKRNPLKNALGAGWGLLRTLRWVGSWHPTYLASFFPSSREKISQWESNRQPLHQKWVSLHYISPGSLGSSQTTDKLTFATLVQRHDVLFLSFFKIV